LNSKDALALWNMTLDQKREEAVRRKDKGNHIKIKVHYYHSKTYILNLLTFFFIQ
jgi:hypothetical protein